MMIPQLGCQDREAHFGHTKEVAMYLNQEPACVFIVYVEQQRPTLALMRLSLSVLYLGHSMGLSSERSDDADMMRCELWHDKTRHRPNNSA
jgi:hypothetical protein